MSYANWTDTAGNLFLFGGYRDVIGVTNDVWKFDINSNEWTWIIGPNIGGNHGHYGIQCSADTGNLPSCRSVNKMNFIDDCGNFWMFGGVRDYFTSLNAENSLWEFNSRLNNWILAKGC